MKEYQTIKVCHDCGVPLIWTFCWANSEYYCINCGGHWGMLGSGKNIKATKDLKAQYRKLNRLWKVIYKNLIPRSNYQKTNCAKCKTEHSHRDHLTKREILKDKVATKILIQLHGLWG